MVNINVIACNHGTTYISIVYRKPGCAWKYSTEVPIVDYSFPPPTTAMAIFDYRSLTT